METKTKIKPQKSLRSYMIDMLIMLLPAFLLAIYYYGTRPILLVGISSGAAVLCEWLACKARRIESTLPDLSALFTGAVIALMLPVAVPLWMPAVGSVFAILVAKVPFGNVLKTPFVPAAAGLAFILVSWSEVAFIYPAPSAEVVVGSDANFIPAQSLASMLQNNASITPDWFSFLNLLVGKVPGPMGSTSTLVLLSMLVYLGIRRPKSFMISASFLVACSLFAVLFPRVLSGRFMSLGMELSSGLLVFTALFLVNNPATSPRSLFARMIYGMGAGFLAMILRYNGTFEDGSVFAVLLMNAFWPAIQHIASHKKHGRSLLAFHVNDKDLQNADKLRPDELEDKDQLPKAKEVE